MKRLFVFLAKTVLLTWIITCTVICMISAFPGQNNAYKDVKGENFKVTVQVNNQSQMEKILNSGYKTDDIQQVQDKAMLTFEYNNSPDAQTAYLKLKSLGQTAYLEGSMLLDEKEGALLLKDQSFAQRGNMYYNKENIQSILRKTADGYYLTTGYPFIISGC